MPSPRVFVSSTCYDLRYIRENLRFFIRTLGYEAVLSEDGAVFYNPRLHVQDACIADVPACQLFILIIGGRYGGRFRDTEKSITNAEYEAAAKAKIPVFALVEKPVFEQFGVYLANKNNPTVDTGKISYPAVDSIRIFDFVEQVQNAAVNNALVPFADFEEMQAYLKQQWASMMFRFLTSESEAKRVGDLFTALSATTEKIEFLTRGVVESVGDKNTRIQLELYDLLLNSHTGQLLAAWKKVTPRDVLKNNTLEEFCGDHIQFLENPNEDLVFYHGGPPFRLGKGRYESMVKDYQKLRAELVEKLSEEGIAVETLLQDA